MITTVSLSQESMVHLATSLLEAWNAHDIERILAFYAPDYEGQDVAEAEPQRGLAGARQSINVYLQAFPNLCLCQESVVVQGNQLVLVWTASGTHRGPLMGVPPTGRPVQFQGMSLLTISDGKISRALQIWDVAGWLRCLGLLPEL